MRAILISLLLLSAVGLRAGELLDGIVATVNDRVILKSDWNDEVRLECFMSGRPLADLTSQEKKAALDRLIDRELLHQQMRTTDLKPVSADEVEKQINALKNDQVLQHSRDSWDAALSRYQLSQKMVADYVGSELTEFRSVDAHFRPSIQIPEPEIARYYREQLLPRMPASEPTSLLAATPKIREILIQEKINRSLNSWLQRLRSQARIRILSSSGAADPEAMRTEMP
jgi:hypothetical protein